MQGCGKIGIYPAKHPKITEKTKEIKAKNNRRYNPHPISH
jgi:hypothetical protein